jgi:hypothetical protein
LDLARALSSSSGSTSLPSLLLLDTLPFFGGVSRRPFIGGETGGGRVRWPEESGAPILGEVSQSPPKVAILYA